VALQEVQQNANAGILEHAVSGASALKPQARDTAVRRLLKRKSTRREKQWVPFYERMWFLAGCAALVLGLCTWAFWPASEEQLFAKAEGLMASGERVQWMEAREIYRKLLAKFPDGVHAEQARQHLEQIEMKSAQIRMETSLRFGRPGKTEGERRYAKAWEREEAGELPEALALYEELIEKVDANGDDAPFVKLARQQIEKLKPAVALAAAAEKSPDAAPASAKPDGDTVPTSSAIAPGAGDAFPAGAAPVASPGNDPSL
jgi:hypothetical protein